MKRTITITEILDRSEQGMTRPFLCRADDGRLYYVKGKYAGQRSLCCEWVAGSLARALGLPVPDFMIAEVPRVLIEGSDRDDIRDLGSGPVFASARLENAREITWAEVERWSLEMKARIVHFDWWVQNEDRTLSSLGGNPNLLITAEPKEDLYGGDWDDEIEVSAKTSFQDCLWMFDFNLAFDASFDAHRFRSAHIFSETMIPANLPIEWRHKMQEALRSLSEIFENLPCEWLYLDGDESLAMQLDQTQVYEILNRAFTETDAFGRLQ